MSDGRCAYLATLGCDVPAERAMRDELARLEVRVCGGSASPDEIARYRDLRAQYESVSERLDAIFGGSCFLRRDLHRDTTR